MRLLYSSARACDPGSVGVPPARQAAKRAHDSPEFWIRHQDLGQLPHPHLPRCYHCKLSSSVLAKLLHHFGEHLPFYHGVFLAKVQQDCPGQCMLISTGMRVPLMTGFPAIICGWLAMRARKDSLISVASVGTCCRRLAANGCAPASYAVCDP